MALGVAFLTQNVFSVVLVVLEFESERTITSPSAILVKYAPIWLAEHLLRRTWKQQHHPW